MKTRMDGTTSIEALSQPALVATSPKLWWGVSVALHIALVLLCFTLASAVPLTQHNWIALRLEFEDPNELTSLRWGYEADISIPQGFKVHACGPRRLPEPVPMFCVEAFVEPPCPEALDLDLAAAFIQAVPSSMKNDGAEIAAGYSESKPFSNVYRGCKCRARCRDKAAHIERTSK